MNELQISLIALGAAAVVGIFAYNKWQESRQRRQAEAAFRSEHPDVLMETGSGSGSERIEPTFGPEVETITITEPAEAAPEVAELPAELADSHIDCVVRVEAADPVPAPALWQARRETFGALQERVRWLGWNEVHGRWEPLTANSAGSHRQLAALLQLADRGGAVSEDEVAAFLDGVQRVADRFLAVTGAPERGGVAAAAAELDRFCAGVDVQIGVNLVANDPAGIPGTKLRGVAEAAGFAFSGDGSFHYADDHGQVLFTLGNLEPALFAAGEMKSLVTHGLTFTLDVPRVSDGGAAFDRMIVSARQVAVGLNGSLVDDNRVPLADSALKLIRGKIVEFQKTMAARGIPAGSPAALRLFE